MKWTQLCPFYRFRYLRYLSVLSQLKPMVNLWNWDLNILNHKVIIIFFLVYVALIYILTCHF